MFSSKAMLKVIGLLLVATCCLAAQGSEGEIILSEEFRLEETYFGLIQGVDVDRAGRIYVGDMVRACVHLFSDQGKYIRSIGRKGRGPGEFSYVWDVSLLEPDSLCVFDGATRLLSIFAPDRFESPVRTIAIPPVTGGYAPSPLGTIASGTKGVWADKNLFFVPYASEYTAGGLDKVPRVLMYVLNRKGNFQTSTPIITMAQKQRFIIQGENGFSVGEMPFARRPVIAVGNDGLIYHGDTDNTNVYVKTPTGALKHIIALDEKRIRITPAMWQRELERWPDRKLTMSTLHRSKTPLPEFLPVFEQMLIDDRGRVWIGFSTDNKDFLRWEVLTSEGKRLHSLTLTKDAMLLLIRQGRAYALHTDNNGVQSVIVYRLHERSR